MATDKDPSPGHSHYTNQNYRFITYNLSSESCDDRFLSLSQAEFLYVEKLRHTIALICLTLRYLKD